MRLWSYYFVLLFLMMSCQSSTKEPYVLPDNARFLLTADSVKHWKLAKRYNGKTRMNMGDCFLKYRQHFRESGQVIDNNEENKGCGPSLKADWEFTSSDKGYWYLKFTSEQIPELLGQTEDYKLFKIHKLTQDSLMLSFTHKQFGERRVITDYLVRHDLEVDDRNFHW